MIGNEQIISQMEEFLNSTYQAKRPGAAVIVVKDQQVLLRKGYGMANLELGVPIKPHMVFRLGSITKQFTAVSILMLVEQGLIQVEDEITRFLPDYPTQGRKITVHHLLTHTAGIKSYTDLPEWLGLWRKDMQVDEIITLFKDQPMEFEPGEHFKYNNSGYILLGAIIEKLSGLSYADFVQKNIFDRLGMEHSLYDDTARLVPGRVAGYTRGINGYENAAYLSMSQPYAAGSLASCVDDLAKWDAALYTDQLVRQETLGMAFQSGILNNGETTGYGYGWGIGQYEGHLFIEHGGGINGFTTGGLRVPDQRVYVAVLTNSGRPEVDPAIVAFRLATMAIGKPWSEPLPIQLTASELDAYIGVYQINAEEERVIVRDGLQLFSQRTGGIRIGIFPYAADKFFIKDNPDYFVFNRDESGRVKEMRAIRRTGPEEIALKTDKPLPSQRPAISLPQELLERYMGTYEMAPGMVFRVERSGDQLSIEAPGQEKMPLRAESPERLFSTTIDLTLEYEFDEAGQVKDCVLRQGTQSYPCKKIR